MIKVYKIVTIIIVLIVICAPSCGDEQAANQEKAILNDTDVPTPVSDSLSNMKVIDKILESHKTGTRIAF